MTDATIAQLVTFATVVAGFLYQIFAQGRQRKWDIEDRRQTNARAERVAVDVATRVEATAATLVDTTHRTAAQLAAKVDTTTAGLHSAIADNTAKTKEAIAAANEAYQEANSVNVKIEQIGLDNKAVLDRVANGKPK